MTDTMKEILEAIKRIGEPCKCGKAPRDLHPCPFASDVYDDQESLCNCCDNCANDCAMDI